MNFVIPGCKPEPPLRAAAKRLHLTFAALYPGELDHTKLLNAARRWGSTRLGLREYVTGREKHTQPADPQRDEHFHMYISFGKKADLPDRLRSTVFDMTGRDGRTLHPEIQAVGPTPGDRERVINYDMKDGDWKGELVTPLVHDEQRDATEQAAAGSDDDDDDSTDSTPAWAKMLNKATSVREGMELLAEKAPHIYYSQGTRIEPMLAKRVGTGPHVQLFTLDDFNRPALDLDFPTVLHGSTDCGKTAFAKAHFECPLIVRRRDDLKKMSGAYDGIIFDDCNFRDWTPEDAICLLDWDESRSLPARYSDAYVEADIPLIFTTNRKPSKIFPRASTKKQRDAIKRRYTAVEVTGPLQQGGRPFTPAEKRARREAGRNGPQGP